MHGQRDWDVYVDLLQKVKYILFGIYVVFEIKAKIKYPFEQNYPFCACSFCMSSKNPSILIIVIQGIHVLTVDPLGDVHPLSPGKSGDPPVGLLVSLWISAEVKASMSACAGQHKGLDLVVAAGLILALPLSLPVLPPPHAENAQRLWGSNLPLTGSAGFLQGHTDRACLAWAVRSFRHVCNTSMGSTLITCAGGLLSPQCWKRETATIGDWKVLELIQIYLEGMNSGWTIWALTLNWFCDIM